MTTESVDHEAALRLIHTGKVLAGRPTWGSWVIYALGSENQNLPAYVVLSDPGGLPVDGVRNWSSGWLPAIYQGTPFRSGGDAGPQPRDAPGADGRGPRRPAAVPRRAQPRPPGPASRQHRARGPDRQLRDRRADADGRPRGRSTSPASPRRSAGCTAWTTRPPASTARAA